MKYRFDAAKRYIRHLLYMQGVQSSISKDGE